MTATSPAITLQVKDHDRVMEPYRHGTWPMEIDELTVLRR